MKTEVKEMKEERDLCKKEKEDLRKELNKKIEKIRRGKSDLREKVKIGIRNLKEMKEKKKGLFEERNIAKKKVESLIVELDSLKRNASVLEAKNAKLQKEWVAMNKLCMKKVEKMERKIGGSLEEKELPPLVRGEKEIEFRVNIGKRCLPSIATAKWDWYVGPLGHGNMKTTPLSFPHICPFLPASYVK